MTKRIATTELNHNNWNEEEEPEEVQIGIPSAAPTELKKRVLLTGKRRAGVQSSSSSAAKSVFAGFAGFGKSSTNGSFNVTQNGSTNVQNSTMSVKEEKSRDKIIFVDVDKDTATKNRPVDFQYIKNDDLSAHASAGGLEHKQFCKHVKVLNNGVLHWIDQHVKNNPYLDLRPVFRDYIDHYKTLENKFINLEKSDAKVAKTSNGLNGQQNTVEKPSKSIFANPVLKNLDNNLQQNGKPTINGEKNDPEVTGSASDSPSTFSFGFNGDTRLLSVTSKSDAKTSAIETSSSTTTAATTITSVANLVSFSDVNKDSKDNDAVEKPPSLLFSFLNKPTGSDGSTSNTDEATRTDAPNDEDNAEYQPPKPESIQVEEKDAYHSVKCKLFYKSGTKYVEKGVGTLHLKKLESGKTQLLIRTDTALGNILLNVCLSEATPCNKINKNNLTLACIPNPPLEPAKNDDKKETDDKQQQLKTAIMLIRVKTESDAEALFSLIDKARKS